ncbi:trehalose-phosphatase [Rhizobacter sp. J219]|jgi:trehalose 6-phosphate phosphatase|uniref:trehalose-phosphatase n=1 Tax=Rhizobacter sp. J219 TaxID=2898430 RepID=UPI002151C86E|nr:trehalose-phosphatase [Rhizobacter sp. J219]MCR5882866.1 trehalose-phosphatase [Rhizobacter sp. J219]
MMQPLLTPEGMQALRGAMDQAVLLAFDFDGTLAPIVDDPTAARPSAEVVEVMKDLVRRHPVAIVSGRARHDVATRLGFEPRFIVGNHGADGADGGMQQWSPEVLSAVVTWQDRLTSNRSMLAHAGVAIEDKGESWTLHYRTAPDPASARHEIARFLSDLHPLLRAFDGKFCVNVVVAASPTKGDAVERIAKEAKAESVIYFGDDVTDESVYWRNDEWVTVHVGYDITFDEARFVLEQQDDVLAALRLLRTLSRVSG